jgi:hypothetical protein
MAFVPVFQIQAAQYTPNGIDALVTLWIETTRGSALTITRLIPSPSSPTPITKAQVFAACKQLANNLEAAEAAAVAATPKPVLSDPTIYDATQGGAVAASPVNIAPLTGSAPVGGATV